MSYFLVKVIDADGWHIPPIVAHADDEAQALEHVRVMYPDTCTIRVGGIRPDVMAAAFGEVPLGAAVIRHDWTWRGPDDETPEPY